MNPYLQRILGLVGDRSPVESMQESLQRIEALAPRLNPELSYAQGKWTAREILCHMADCELGMGFRIRQILSEDNHTVQPFEQDDWARLYGDVSMTQALQAFKGLRRWHLALIAGLSEEQLERTYYHPGRGEWESLRTLVGFLAGHDLNHLAQLEAIAGLSEAAQP